MEQPGKDKQQLSFPFSLNGAETAVRKRGVRNIVCLSLSAVPSMLSLYQAREYIRELPVFNSRVSVRSCARPGALRLVVRVIAYNFWRPRRSNA
ncbi:hypothetical protein DdX_19294 [Ditylenchus destructor]|uniref:Uncharacterized protein n=1 Tax=Ditylenchus destructor TaxID=166010 RepID=A0AAD4MMW2_9BILA|nr:hypothetical protein DdX_19294 [Ditylenchus destructor]